MSAPWLLPLLLTVVPPGHTKYSVELALDCTPTAESCPDARWSPHYGSWVRKETAETGRERYELVARSLELEAQALLCQLADGSPIAGCTPTRGALDYRGRRRWEVRRLIVLGAAVAIVEGGLREDVQVGRGSAKKASPDGGRGRGPSGDGCLMQVNPASAWMFADVDGETYELAKGGDKTAREAVVQSLLGTEEEQVRRCWRTGLRMLIHARHYCAWKSPETDPIWASVALFGTGSSCTSENEGKTAARVRLYGQLWAKVGKAPKAAKREALAARE